MRYVALEEAFYIPELGERQPMPNDSLTRLPSRWNAEVAKRFAARLPDVAKYRLPEMDDAGIDMQILSLTVPGLQVDIEPELATKNARFANDYTAEMVAKHPDRFGAFAALPLQDPAAAAAELERAVTELGLRGALVNDCIHGPGGRYLDAPEYDEVWSALESLNVPRICTLARRRPTTGRFWRAARKCMGQRGVGAPRWAATRCVSSSAGYSTGTPARP